MSKTEEKTYDIQVIINLVAEGMEAEQTDRVKFTDCPYGEPMEKRMWEAGWLRSWGERGQNRGKLTIREETAMMIHIRENKRLLAEAQA